jgi:hypothetical protein
VIAAWAVLVLVGVLAEQAQTAKARRTQSSPVVEQPGTPRKQNPNGGIWRGIVRLSDIAVWKFSSEGSLFSSGDVESCGSKGLQSNSLDGAQRRL